MTSRFLLTSSLTMYHSPLRQPLHEGSKKTKSPISDFFMCFSGLCCYKEEPVLLDKVSLEREHKGFGRQLGS